MATIKITSVFGVFNNIPIVKGTLRLIRMDLLPEIGQIGININTGNLIIYSNKYQNERLDYEMVLPIIINNKEQVEIGDSYLVRLYDLKDKAKDVIEQVESINEGVWVNQGEVDKTRHIDNCNKILALPEQFSPEQLSNIVEKKLTESDYLMIKIEENKTAKEWEYFTKLDESGYIMIVDNGRKEFTFDDMDLLRRRAISFGASDSLNDWFDKNVKTKYERK